MFYNHWHIHIALPLQSILVGPPSIEAVNIIANVCYVSVMWSSKRNEACGAISYNLQLEYSGHVVKNMNTTSSEISMISLAPDTSYRLNITAINGTQEGIRMKRMISTGKPTSECNLNNYTYILYCVCLLYCGEDENITTKWHCNESYVCGIFAKWIIVSFSSCSISFSPEGFFR